MLESVRGLVIRTVDYKEADRLISIFTEEKGIVHAMARGARSLRSRQMAATQQFCYATFVLYKKGELYWVREAELIESFFGLRAGVEGLALASYFCEVLSDVALAESDRELLRVSLNSLYAIAEQKCELPKIKAAFEMRVCAVLGFMPDVLACHHCQRRDGEFYFDIMDAKITCAQCHAQQQDDLPADPQDGTRHIVCRLTPGAKVALGYVIYCPPEKLFSFRVAQEDMRSFSHATECYLLNQLERSFRTLDFYREVAVLQGKDS